MRAMPQTAFSLEVEGAGLKVTVGAGALVSPALMLDMLRQVFMLPAAMAARVLWDLRAGKPDPQLDDEAVRQIAAYVRDRQSERAVKLRAAFVVDRASSLDLARRVSFLAENISPAAAMFQDEGDAWRWLAQDRDSA
jgi:hypothetical protein